MFCAVLLIFKTARGVCDLIQLCGLHLFFFCAFCAFVFMFCAVLLIFKTARGVCDLILCACEPYTRVFVRARVTACLFG